MRVGCWDCGVSNPKYERPRTKRSGMKNTVSVCKECRDKWFRENK